MSGGSDHLEPPVPTWFSGVGAWTRSQLWGPAQPSENAVLRVLWHHPGSVGLRSGP